jgi:hypothetical protein
MDTSRTPPLWERFLLLLFTATGITFALTALRDALRLRRARCSARKDLGPPAGSPATPYAPEPTPFPPPEPRPTHHPPESLAV